MSRQKQCCGNKNRRHEKAGYTLSGFAFRLASACRWRRRRFICWRDRREFEEGSPGKLDMTSQTELVFVSSSVRLVIPYASIDSYDHSQRVTHHLGVLPAIAVSLVKKRQRKHFLRIAYHDEIKTPQVAIFEVPKKMPLTLLAILQQRAPQGCKPQPYSECRVVPD
jgi:hypothetical protein